MRLTALSHNNSASRIHDRLTESLVRLGLLKRRREAREIKRGDIYFDYALSKSRLVTIMYFGVAVRLPIRRLFKVYHRTLHRVYTLNKLNQSERAIYFSAPRCYRDFQLTKVHGGSGGKPRAAAQKTGRANLIYPRTRERIRRAVCS